MSEYPQAVARFAEVLAELGHPNTPIMMSDSTRTAVEAAEAVGVELGQIVKSLVFRRKEDDAVVLVLTSGDNRVDEKKVSALTGKIGKADADFVKEKSGYTIGGVPPFGHDTEPVALMDEDLLRFDVVWAAAGNPKAVFELTPAQLLEYSGAKLANVAKK
ncbi:MAG: YbaK/EbsC family protein [Propionibacteriaceae bacterium]|jgi:prolyl-tRNA editing enzyme YbaK/EbsC (Cys-tRNA(Pro) deacylase)|nr:YbaK/EbsC family protein [Propionibacteriaceae bacterium]